MFRRSSTCSSSNHIALVLIALMLHQSSSLRVDNRRPSTPSGGPKRLLNITSPDGAIETLQLSSVDDSTNITEEADTIATPVTPTLIISSSQSTESTSVDLISNLGTSDGPTSAATTSSIQSNDSTTKTTQILATTPVTTDLSRDVSTSQMAGSTSAANTTTASAAEVDTSSSITTSTVQATSSTQNSTPVLVSALVGETITGISPLPQSIDLWVTTVNDDVIDAPDNSSPSATFEPATADGSPDVPTLKASTSETPSNYESQTQAPPSVYIQVVTTTTATTISSTPKQNAVYMSSLRIKSMQFDPAMSTYGSPAYLTAFIGIVPLLNSSYSTSLGVKFIRILSVAFSQGSVIVQNYIALSALLSQADISLTLLTVTDTFKRNGYDIDGFSMTLDNSNQNQGNSSVGPTDNPQSASTFNVVIIALVASILAIVCFLIVVLTIVICRRRRSTSRSATSVASGSWRSSGYSSSSVPGVENPDSQVYKPPTGLPRTKLTISIWQENPTFSAIDQLHPSNGFASDDRAFYRQTSVVRRTGDDSPSVLSSPTTSGLGEYARELTDRRMIYWDYFGAAPTTLRRTVEPWNGDGATAMHASASQLSRRSGHNSSTLRRERKPRLSMHPRTATSGNNSRRHDPTGTAVDFGGVFVPGDVLDQWRVTSVAVQGTRKQDNPNAGSNHHVMRMTSFSDGSDSASIDMALRVAQFTAVTGKPSKRAKNTEKTFDILHRNR